MWSPEIRAFSYLIWYIKCMNVDELTLEELRDLGWDGYSWTLNDFKARLRAALDLGWDPSEMSLEEFEEQEEDAELTEDERRDRAEQEGWDEEEMDLDEFEDLFMK